MSPIRVFARPMLASMFIVGGVDALSDPAARSPKARTVTEPLAESVPALQGVDPEVLVRVNAAAQVVGGLLLAIGRLPRLASTILAATLGPTTLAGHRFWEESDPGARANQRIHFLKNVSMLGGLLIAAMDTEGQPGLRWRASHAVEHAEHAVEQAVDRTRREVRLAARLARAEARRTRAEATRRARRGPGRGRH